MAHSHLLKAIDWYISIPESSLSSEVFKNEDGISSFFIIEFNNKKTQWRLVYNLNLNDTGNFFVILECCSDPDDIDFDCTLSASVVNSPLHVHKAGDLLKSKLKEGNNWGLILMPSKDLLENNSGLRPDGTLHLRITIRAINLTQKHDPNMTVTKESLIELLNLNANFNDSSSSADDSVFDVITATSESNVLIKTDDGMALKANKSVLSEKSSVFKSMFTIDMEEAASKSVDIIEFKGPVMRELIRFIYFGKVRDLEQINMELYKAAEVYNVQELREICLKSIITEICQENFFDVVQFAELYDIRPVFDYCCNKIKNLRHHQSIQEEIKKLDMKLQIKIMEKIIQMMTKTETFIEVQSCNLTD